MKARAALALNAGAPLVIDEVEVAGPKAGEGTGSNGRQWRLSHRCLYAIGR